MARKFEGVKETCPELPETPSGPVLIPAGTVTVMMVSLAILTSVALTPFQKKSRTGEPLKPLPVICIESPAVPAAGVKPSITGSCANALKARATQQNKEVGRQTNKDLRQLLAAKKPPSILADFTAYIVIGFRNEKQS